MILLAQFNTLLALGSILLQISIIAGVYVLLMRERPWARRIIDSVARFAVPLAFLLALVGSALTLFYSEIIGYAPCSLCWFQRIFLYPQVIILGIAWWKRDTRIADYVIALAVFGAVFALYQYYIQMGGGTGLPCPAGSGGGDCARRYIFEFGYITFPFMAFVTFAVNAVLMLFLRRSSR